MLYDHATVFTLEISSYGKYKNASLLLKLFTFMLTFHLICSVIWPHKHAQKCITFLETFYFHAEVSFNFVLSFGVANKHKDSPLPLKPFMSRLYLFRSN